MTTMLPMLAYFGPGSLFGGIGSAIALIGAVVLALIGFVWYPVKRMLRGNRKDSTTANRSGDPQT